MRITCVVIMVVAAVLLTSCGGGKDNPYEAPDMGKAESLPPGTQPSVADANAGLALLQGALYNVDTLVTATQGRGAGAVSKGLPSFGSSRSSGSAKSYTPVTMSEHVTFSAAPGIAGIGVSGSADISLKNWPGSGAVSSDPVNCSMSLAQELTITEDHVVMGARYTLSGKQICNVGIDVNATGTYGAPTVTGDFKAGFGLACTIDDNSTHTSAKLILSLSADGSLTSMSGSVPATGTLYVYNATNNALIGSRTLTGAEVSDLILIEAGM